MLFNVFVISVTAYITIRKGKLLVKDVTVNKDVDPETQEIGFKG